MFFEQLKKACKMRNISVTAVITQLNISKSNATNWKNGTMPNGEVVVRLSELLEVSTDFLLKGFEESGDKIGINNQSPTITNSSNVEFNGIKHENNINKCESALSENAKELVKVFENLPTKEQIKLMNLVYNYEEQYHKSST